MKSLLVLILSLNLILDSSGYVRSVDDDGVLCFDDSEEAINTAFKQFEECGVTKENAKQENINEAYMCILRNLEVVKSESDENEQVLIEKFKDMEKQDIKNKETELMNAIDECAENKAQAEAKIFVECYDEKLEKICPNDKCIFDGATGNGKILNSPNM